MEFPIELDRNSNVPIYRQLTRALREELLSGRVKAGQQLPSTRQLAESLRISRDTAQRCYEELLNQGLIQVTRRGRTYAHTDLDIDDIHERSAIEPAKDESEKIELSRFSSHVSSVTGSMDLCGELAGSMNEGPPFELLPARQWRAILRQKCQVEELAQTEIPSSPLGFLPLRESIASYLRTAKAVRCHSDNVAIFTGAQFALNLLSRILIDPGDVVAVEDPGYSPARDNFRSCGARIYPVQVDNKGLVVSELERIEQRVKLLYLTPSHHGPAGIQMSLDRRKELIFWAEKTNSIILEDARRGDYRFGYQSLPALQGMEGAKSVVFLYSFADILKPFSSISCLILPPSMLDIFARAKLLLDSNARTIDQNVLAEFIEKGHLQRYLRKTRAAYESARQALIYSLVQSFKTSVRFQRASAGLELRVQFDLPVAEQKLLDCANRVGLRMISTGPCYWRSRVSREFLIPFSSMPGDRIAESVRRFAKNLVAEVRENRIETGCFGPENAEIGCRNI